MDLAPPLAGGVLALNNLTLPVDDLVPLAREG